MVLNRNGKLVRFAYSQSEYGPPQQTSLCALFWRAFVGMPLLYLVQGAAILGICTGFSGLVWKFPIIFLVILGVGLLFGIATAVDNHLDGNPNFVTTLHDRVESSVFVQGVKAIKGKFCPLIDIK